MNKNFKKIAVVATMLPTVAGATSYAETSLVSENQDWHGLDTIDIYNFFTNFGINKPLFMVNKQDPTYSQKSATNGTGKAVKLYIPAGVKDVDEYFSKLTTVENKDRTYTITSINVTGTEHDELEKYFSKYPTARPAEGNIDYKVLGDLYFDGGNTNSTHEAKSGEKSLPKLITTFDLSDYFRAFGIELDHSDSAYGETGTFNIQGNVVLNYTLPKDATLDEEMVRQSLEYDKESFKTPEVSVSEYNGEKSLKISLTPNFKDINDTYTVAELRNTHLFKNPKSTIKFDGLGIGNSAKNGIHTIKAEIGGSNLLYSTKEAGRGLFYIFATSQDSTGKDSSSKSDNSIVASFKVNSSSDGSSTYIPGQDPDRIDGVDRVETAVNVSKETYPNGANAVILANKNKFSDVLTAVPLSVQIGAPILFTNTDTLPQETKDEITRLNPSTIYINGGTESVAKAIETNLSNSGKSVTRFNGVDRYHTAKLIAEKIREKGDKRVVEIASGETFPDALSISSLAVKENAPILLSKKDDLTKYTKSALATWDIDKATIAGHTETISNTVQGLVTSGFNIGDTKNPDNVFRGAKDTRRIGGADRYETSTKIAEYTLPDATFGVYASGQVFADSLIAGPYAAVNKAPVLLVKRDAMPNSVQDYTKKSKINKAKLIGGENTVNNNVLNLIKSLVANKK